MKSKIDVVYSGAVWKADMNIVVQIEKETNCCKCIIFTWKER